MRLQGKARLICPWLVGDAEHITLILRFRYLQASLLRADETLWDNRKSFAAGFVMSEELYEVE
jgi:hypothetical protein